MSLYDDTPTPEVSALEDLVKKKIKESVLDFDKIRGGEAAASLSQALVHLQAYRLAEVASNDGS